MKDTNLTCYGIHIKEKFPSRKEACKLMKNLYQHTTRLIKNNSSDIRYWGISFILGVSNTESTSAIPIYIKNHTKGRPKKEIIGTKNEWHIHIYIANYKGSLFPVCESIEKYLKGKGYTVYRRKNDNIIKALNYVEKQSISVWRYGEDFKSKNKEEKIYFSQENK